MKKPYATLAAIYLFVCGIYLAGLLPAAAAPLYVYQEDALNAPWVDTSYTNARTFNSAEQAYAGNTSVKIVNGAWGAFGARSGPWGIHNDIVASQYDGLSIAVHGGAQGANLRFRLYNDSGDSFPNYSFGGIPAGAWTAIAIPMASLNPSGYPIHSLAVSEVSGQTRTFYIDELRFSAAGTSTPDTVAPAVAMTAPADSTTVAGVVSVSASSSDGIGVAGVRFLLDGVNLGSEDTSSPYAISWDTASADNATHTLLAVARDAAGNAATSAAVSVMVSNVASSGPAKIMLLGDSITEFDWQGGYRSQLFRLLDLGGYDFDFVGRKNNNHDDTNLGFIFPSAYWDHEGYGSATIGNAGSTYVWNQNITNALTANQPDIILLMLGTNDVYSTVRTAAQIRSEMSAFLDQIWSFDPSIKVVMSTILRTFDGQTDKLAIIQEANALWPGLASEKQQAGRYIDLVDNYGALASSSDIVSDGIHPSPQGYIKMAAAWYPAVVMAIASVTSTTPQDDISPAVSLSSPLDGSVVSSSVAIIAMATDEIGVAGVQFKLDGNNIGAEDAASPYELVWDSATASNGSHIITAVARDAAGNATTSAPVVVTVANTMSPPNIYGESFVAPWSNASYGGTFTPNSTEQAAGGSYSFKAVVSAWGTVRPWAASNPPDVSAYSSLEFDVYNVSGTINPLNVFLQATPSAFSTMLSFSLPGAAKPQPAAGQWTHVSIPLSSFTNAGNPANLPGTRVDYINLQNDGTARTLYVDNMSFR